MTNPHRPRLVLLTNIPAPYRIAFQNILHAELQERGASLAVLYCARTEPNRAWEVDLAAQNYPWEILPGRSVTIGGAYFHVNPGVVSRLRSLAPAWLLVAGSWHAPTNLLALPRGVAGGAARIFWSEGHDDAVRFREGWVAGVRRRVLRAFDGFAVPNVRSGEFLARELGARPALLPLPNTVDEGFFEGARELNRASLRAGFGLDSEKTVFLTVAELHDRKGVDQLLLGYQSLPAPERERSTLVLIGDGPLRESLETQARAASGEVRFLGQRGQSEVRDWLRAADVFVLPSRVDPNPLSVIEAAFAGLPLIISRRAGNAFELVREGETGFIIENVTAESIARRLQGFLACDAETRRCMADGSRRIASDGFRRQTVAARFSELLVERFPPRSGDPAPPAGASRARHS